jgi:hypothetical protein
MFWQKASRHGVDTMNPSNDPTTTISTALMLTGAVLLIIYVVLKFSFHKSVPPPEPRRTFSAPGEPMDTRPLSERLNAVRRNYTAVPADRTTAFKKPLMVSDRRAAIAKSPYFHEPRPEPDEPEHGSGWSLLFA